MDEPGEHDAQWDKPDTGGQTLCDSPYSRSPEESDPQRQEVAGGGQGLGEGNEELLFNGERVSVWEDEKVLEIDDEDGCTTMWVHSRPLSCALKND